MKWRVGWGHFNGKTLISTEKISLCFLVCTSYAPLPLSFISLSCFMSDIHQKIVQESGKLCVLLIFWKLLGSVLFFCEVTCTRDKRVEKGRVETDQNSNSSIKRGQLSPSFGDVEREKERRNWEWLTVVLFVC